MGYFENLVLQEFIRMATWVAGVTLAVHLLGALGGGAARGTVGAVALVLGFLAGHVIVDGVPEFPPDERWQWLPWLVAASLFLLFLEEVRSGQATLRFAVLLLIVGAFIWFVLEPSSRAGHWGTGLRQTIFIGGGGAVMVVLALAEARAAQDHGWRLLFTFTVAAIGATGAYARGGSLNFGKIAGGLATVLGVGTAMALIQRELPICRTHLSAALLAYGGLLLVAWLSLELPAAVVLLLVAAPLTAFVPLNGNRARVASLAFLLAVVPAGLAIWLAG